VRDLFFWKRGREISGGIESATNKGEKRKGCEEARDR
jgi:hypothetical protein